MIGLSNLVPPINQLSSPTQDGHPDENAGDNCTAAAICWAIHQLTGKVVDPDSLKDEAYGQGYVGMTAFQQYAPVAARYGVRIVSHANLAPWDIVDGIQAALRGGIPCGVAIASDWGDNPPTSQYSHSVCIANASGTGASDIAVAANSWGGFWQRQSWTWWAGRFRLAEYHEIQPMGDPMAWTIERDGNGAITGAKDAKGVPVGAGIAASLEAAGPADLASDAALGEVYFATGRSIAVLENGAWFDWNASSGQVSAHTNGGAVVVALYALVHAAAIRIQQLQQQLATQPAQPPAPAPAPDPVPADPTATALVAAIKAALAAS